MTQYLEPQHNHPVVFVKERYWKQTVKPREMDPVTHQKVMLTRQLILNPRGKGEYRDQYVDRIAKVVGIDPVEADRFLFGALSRRKNHYALQSVEE